MKFLVMLEGNTEKAFIEVLMEKGLFVIDEEDMLDQRPLVKRQIDGYVATMIRQLPFEEKVRVIRIGDKMSDKLKRIPRDIIGKIESEEKYLTRPEFEMLLIIHEDLFKEYQKVKSTKKPKVFAKENIKFNGVRYNNTSEWIKQYFESVDLKTLLAEYKKLMKHDKTQKHLLDLIK